MEPCFRLLTAQLERPLPGEQSAVVSSACRALPELPGNQNDLAVAVLNLVTEHHELCWSTLVSILRLCNGVRAGLTPTPDLLDTPIRIPASICAGNESGPQETQDLLDMPIFRTPTRLPRTPVASRLQEPPWPASTTAGSFQDRRPSRCLHTRRV